MAFGFEQGPIGTTYDQQQTFLYIFVRNLRQTHTKCKEFFLCFFIRQLKKWGTWEDHPMCRPPFISSMDLLTSMEVRHHSASHPPRQGFLGPIFSCPPPRPGLSTDHPLVGSDLLPFGGLGGGWGTYAYLPLFWFGNLTVLSWCSPLKSTCHIYKRKNVCMHACLYIRSYIASINKFTALFIWYACRHVRLNIYICTYIHIVCKFVYL